MFGRAFQIARVFGVGVEIHLSWVIIIGFVVWSLSNGFLPNRYEGWSEAAYWLVGSASAAMLFAAVFVHELSHALVAAVTGAAYLAVLARQEQVEAFLLYLTLVNLMLAGFNMLPGFPLLMAGEYCGRLPGAARRTFVRRPVFQGPSESYSVGASSWLASCFCLVHSGRAYGS